MSPASNRRRFIAGAVCPRCGKMDKLVIDLDTDLRECVSCGFSDPRPGTEAGRANAPANHSQAPPVELTTRVNRPAARLVETPAEPVRLMDPEKN